MQFKLRSKSALTNQGGLPLGNYCNDYFGQLLCKGILIAEVTFRTYQLQDNVDPEEVYANCDSGDNVRPEFLYTDGYIDQNLRLSSDNARNIIALSSVYVTIPCRGKELGKYIIRKILRICGTGYDMALGDVYPYGSFDEKDIQSLKNYYLSMGFKGMPAQLGNNPFFFEIRNHIYIDIPRQLHRRTKYDILPNKLAQEIENILSTYVVPFSDGRIYEGPETGNIKNNGTGKIDFEFYSVGKFLIVHKAPDQTWPSLVTRGLRRYKLNALKNELIGEYLDTDINDDL